MYIYIYIYIVSIREYNKCTHTHTKTSIYIPDRYALYTETYLSKNVHHYTNSDTNWLSCGLSLEKWIRYDVYVLGQQYD